MTSFFFFPSTNRYFRFTADLRSVFVRIRTKTDRKSALNRQLNRLDRMGLIRITTKQGNETQTIGICEGYSVAYKYEFCLKR